MAMVDLAECRVLAARLTEADLDPETTHQAADKMLELVDLVNELEMQISHLRRSVQSASDDAVRAPDA